MNDIVTDTSVFDMNHRKLNKCSLCGSKRFSVYGMKEGQVLESCLSCGLIFLNPQPIVDTRKFYDEGYYRGASEYKTNIGNENVLDPERIQSRIESCSNIVNRVMQYTPQTGRWLDVGCGPGFLVSEAKAAGWRCTGIEPSPFASEMMRRQYGISDIFTGRAEEADYPSDTFDVVSLQHAVEHFLDPVDTMKKIIKWLKPGGLVYLETPDVGSKIAQREGKNWEHIKLPEHLFYFSEQTLRRLASVLGSSVLWVHHPVESTGAMNRICGDQDRAASFYGRFRTNLLIRTAVWLISRLNELYRHRLKGESDIIHILFQKKPLS